jgi:hypothetical protein
MVRANTVSGNDKAHPTWTIGGRTYTSYPDYLKACDRLKQEFLIAGGARPKELGPPLEVPEGATPENFRPEQSWPVAEAIAQTLATRYRVVSAPELDAGNYQPRYLIPGILAAAEPGGIYGVAKTLKTSLAADLLISLASGTPFLGRFPVPEPGRVLFFSGRAGLAGMQSLARRICRERGLSLASLENFSLSTDLPRLDRGIDLVAFRELLEREKPVLIVIDPVGLALSTEKRRNPFALGELLGSFGELCHSMGCALLVVHHCKRSTKPGKPAMLDDVAGSGFAEFSAQWLTVSRRRTGDPGSGHHELWLCAGDGAGHHGLWALDVDEGAAPPVADEGPIVPADPESRTWKTTLRSVAWAEAQADEQYAASKEDRRLRRWAVTSARQRIRVLKFLAAYPDGCTANFIRDELGINGSRMRRILNELVKETVLEASEIEHKKRKDIIYRQKPGMDLSLAAAKAGRVSPPDQTTSEVRSGHFGRGTAPAPGAASAGSNGALQSAGSPDCAGMAPSPVSVGMSITKAVDRPSVAGSPDCVRGGGTKSGPDTLFECEKTEDSAPPGDSEQLIRKKP